MAGFPDELLLPLPLLDELLSSDELPDDDDISSCVPVLELSAPEVLLSSDTLLSPDELLSVDEPPSAAVARPVPPLSVDVDEVASLPPDV